MAQRPPAHPAGLPLPLAVPMAPKPLVLIALNAFKQTGPSPLPAPRAMPARFWAGWLRRLERDLGEIKGQEPGQISPRTHRRVCRGGTPRCPGALSRAAGPQPQFVARRLLPHVPAPLLCPCMGHPRVTAPHPGVPKGLFLGGGSALTPQPWARRDLKEAARPRLMRENKEAGREKQMRRANKEERKGKKKRQEVIFITAWCRASPRGGFSPPALCICCSQGPVCISARIQTPRHCPACIYPSGTAPGPWLSPQRARPEGHGTGRAPLHHLPSPPSLFFFFSLFYFFIFKCLPPK